ncbi:ATP-binding cassette domain-containing protein [Citricoccus sp. SGAir0253]|uniref:MobF family relaxase n=1 Tax=Citricoccus sp. SGAir0253 TaxID=2567881 RepID=UPI0010CCF1BC|nr:MobF family relaxase [Citricoccus sp. SGAir0253]QCU77953.1 ATP-binding cassette domain-containing protein [Citricoccus sp. SGAir0253]
MTVSISKMSIAYYLDSVATGDERHHGRAELTAYYTEAKAPAGRWVGAGLAGTSLTPGQEVTREAAVALYEQARDPKTENLLGRAPMASQTAPTDAKTPLGRAAKATRQAVAGFDLTFSVPKSVSALWAVAGPSLQGQIQQAHERAMNETLAWVEAHVLQSRAGHGGVAHVPVTGLVASQFDHWDSRAGDPQLHTHTVISNRVQRVLDGQWATLDSYTLHRHVVAISETYNSLLFDRLHQQIGALPESRSEDGQQLADALAVATAEDLSAQPDTTGHRVELAGVPDSLIAEFSTRSRAIEARTDELVAEWTTTNGQRPPAAMLLQLRQQATLETRTPKEESSLSLAEKMVGWRERSLATGHDPATVVADAVGHADTTITPDQLTDDIVGQLARWTLADASTRRATFTRANVTASAERITRLVRYRTAAERHQATDKLVDTALAQAVRLTPTRSIAPDTEDPAVVHHGRSVFDHQRTAGLWTTRQVIDDEAYLINRATEETGPHLDPDTITAQVAQVTTSAGHRLSADQARASAAVLSSPRAVAAIIGPAGTGKTTTMAAVAHLWSAAHGESSVVGLAPSAVAAGVLGDELGVATENTTKWLYESVGDGAARRAQRVQQLTAQLHELQARPRTDRTAASIERLAAKLAEQHAAQARYTLAQDQLLILDEASMVSTAQLAELTRQAEAAGAKVLLVGDPAQLEAVDACGFLGWMDRKGTPERLDMVWRFRNAWEREASLRLRTGETDVLGEYAANGRIHGAPGEDAADSAYSAWLADKRAGLSTILIASDNTTVAELNTRAQADLVASGDVDVEQTVTLRGQATAGAGDLVLARRNDRSLRDATGAFIANGTRLTLTGINPDGSAAARNEATGGAVTLDPDYLASSTELGYATTAHRSQGVTVDSAHAVATAGLSRELFYVAMTRGREANHAYVDFGVDHEAHSPDEWGLLTQTPPAQVPVTVLEGVLKRESAEHTAHEVADAQRAWANDLGRMVQELDYLVWAARSARTHQWVQDTYGHDPEALARLSEAATWPQLVKADPALHHHGETEAEDTVPEVLACCTPPTEDAPLSMPQHQPASQREVTTDLLNRIHAELDGRLNRIEANPPAWYDELTQHHPDPAARRAAAADVLIWRAVSGQDDADTALGKAPTEKDTTARYHHAAHAALNPHPENRPVARDARHDALVSGLSDNWINLEPAPPDPAPAEDRLARSTPERERQDVSLNR